MYAQRGAMLIDSQHLHSELLAKIGQLEEQTKSLQSLVAELLIKNQTLRYAVVELRGEERKSVTAHGLGASLTPNVDRSFQ
jgi:hypothetical protein